MKIQALNGAQVSAARPSFGRKPNIAEMEVYTKSLKEGLNLLNKEVDVIIHNSAAPSSWIENVGIGSLFSRTSQKKLMPFLKAHAITGIQQEPNNIRKLSDPSPYTPESSARNILMIPLEKLASSKYGNILSMSLLARIVAKASEDGYVYYDKVNKDFDKALRSAYKNFKAKNIMKEEFEEFKTKNENLEPAAIFRILDNIHGNNKKWEEWGGIDSKLYSTDTEEEAKAAAARIAELKDKYKDEIDYFMFQQFIIDIENKDSNELTKKIGIKIIGDSPVASPACDEWINQKYLLKGKAIGCKPDAFSDQGQRWGFKYFNPKYIFNEDGSLGPAGKVLKQKYDKYFENFPGGLRVDHVIGLVDPFIYTVNSESMTTENSGRLYSAFNGEYKKDKEKYGDLIKKIILKSMEEHGVAKKDLICEDLGDLNIPTVNVMNELDLSGIAVTEFGYRGADTPEKNVIMLGTHDNVSYLEYTRSLFHNSEKKEDLLRRVDYLANDTVPAGTTKKEINDYKQKLMSDEKEFIAASFAELFTSPARRVQISFSDFFGIGKTYNKPSTTHGNWRLRIGNNFDKDYYKAVSEGKAPNLAEAVARALRQRGLDKKHHTLMKNLDNSAKILAEA